MITKTTALTQIMIRGIRMIEIEIEITRKYKANGERGSFSATATGAMGRVAVCDDVNYTKCIAGLRAMLAEQEQEAQEKCDG